MSLDIYNVNVCELSCRIKYMKLVMRLVSIFAETTVKSQKLKLAEYSSFTWQLCWWNDTFCEVDKTQK